MINLVFEKKFLKDIRKLNDASVKGRLKDFLLSFEEALSKSEPENWPPEEIFGIKKLSGYDNYYRIRIGDYRLGLISEIENEIPQIRVVRFLHRREVYRYFP